MNTGDRIRKLRKQINMTQKQLADKVHVSSQVISNWERSYTTPDSDDIKALALALDCSVNQLLGNDDKASPASSSDSENEFESWVNDPRVNKFYKEFKESPDERREALLAAWEYLKSMEKK